MLWGYMGVALSVSDCPTSVSVDSIFLPVLNLRNHWTTFVQTSQAF